MDQAEGRRPEFPNSPRLIFYIDGAQCAIQLHQAAARATVSSSMSARSSAA
jgi:hypothetical protein